MILENALKSRIKERILIAYKMLCLEVPDDSIIEAKANRIHNCLKKLKFKVDDELIDYLIILSELPKIEVERFNKDGYRVISLEEYIDSFLNEKEEDKEEGKEEDKGEDKQEPSLKFQELVGSIIKETFKIEEHALNFSELVSEYFEKGQNNRDKFIMSAQIIIIQDYIRRNERIRKSYSADSIIEILEQLNPLISEASEEFETTLGDFCKYYPLSDIRRSLINEFKMLFFIDDLLIRGNFNGIDIDGKEIDSIKKILNGLKGKGFLDDEGESIDIKKKIEILDSMDKSDVDKLKRLFLGNQKKSEYPSIMLSEKYEKAFKDYFNYKRDIEKQNNPAVFLRKVIDLSTKLGIKPFDLTRVFMPYVPYQAIGKAEYKSDFISILLDQFIPEKYVGFPDDNGADDNISNIQLDKVSSGRREFFYILSGANTIFEKLMIAYMMSMEKGIPGLEKNELDDFVKFLEKNINTDDFFPSYLRKTPIEMRTEQGDFITELLVAYYFDRNDSRAGRTIELNDFIRNNKKELFNQFKSRLSKQEKNIIEKIGGNLDGTKAGKQDYSSHNSKTEGTAQDDDWEQPQ